MRNIPAEQRQWPVQRHRPAGGSGAHGLELERAYSRSGSRCTRTLRHHGIAGLTHRDYIAFLASEQTMRTSTKGRASTSRCSRTRDVDQAQHYAFRNRVTFPSQRGGELGIEHSELRERSRVRGSGWRWGARSRSQQRRRRSIRLQEQRAHSPQGEPLPRGEAGRRRPQPVWRRVESHARESEGEALSGALNRRAFQSSVVYVLNFGSGRSIPSLGHCGVARR